MRLKIQKGDRWGRVECIRSEIEETADLMRRSDGSTYEIGTYSPHPIIVLRCECGKEITFEDDDAIHFPGKRKVMDCGECKASTKVANSMGDFTIIMSFTTPARVRFALQEYANELRINLSQAITRLIEEGIVRYEEEKAK